jgi:hypothetical protein
MLIRAAAHRVWEEWIINFNALRYKKALFSEEGFFYIIDACRFYFMLRSAMVFFSSSFKLASRTCMSTS